VASDTDRQRPEQHGICAPAERHASGCRPLRSLQDSPNIIQRERMSEIDRSINLNKRHQTAASAFLFFDLPGLTGFFA